MQGAETPASEAYQAYVARAWGLNATPQVAF